MRWEKQDTPLSYLHTLTKWNANYQVVSSFFLLMLIIILIGEHKSKLKQAEDVNDLMLLQRRPRPRMCRQEYKEPQEEFRGMWETKAAPKAPNQPKQPKQQRKRRAPKAPKEQKEKKMKEDDELQKD